MIAALLLTTIPIDATALDSVDVLEVNHFHDDCGRHVFSQVIAWDFDYRACRFVCRDWRMIRCQHQRIQFDHGREDAFMLWQDGDVTREVRAGSVRESWTQTDPELLDRDLLPKERRRLLHQSSARRAGTPSPHPSSE